MPRDLTITQFERKCDNWGFRKCAGFFGYYEVSTEPVVCVSVFNAGPNRRDQLKYLIEQHKDIRRKYD